jgi:hypothetical protein
MSIDKGSIFWGGSIQYDTGSSNAVAIDNNGNVVEVHIGADTYIECLFYRVGKVDFGKQTIVWGKSTQYDTGLSNVVALDNNGNVVEVHTGTHRRFYRVGKVDFGKQTIMWGTSAAVEYGKGAQNIPALDDNGNVVEVNKAQDWPAYHVGKVDFDNQTITWGGRYRVGDEYSLTTASSIAIDDNGFVVIATVGPPYFPTDIPPIPILSYQIAKVDFKHQTIDWPGIGSQYDTGSWAAIAVTGDGNAVEVHVGSNRLFYRIGKGKLSSAIQVMYLNRTREAGSGRVMIVDYSAGQVPGQQLYLEKWGDSPLLDGWEDDNDWHAVGDFLARGHDQVMYWNRDEQAGSGRVMIVDYSAGQVPGQVLYWEKWGDSDLLDGWEDDNNWHLQASFILR